MTQERQRVVIAELCGWFFSDRHWHMPNGAKATADGGPDSPPDYLNDLNAMHEAEEQLKVSGNYSGYIGHLKTIVSGGVALCVHATAAQRAEAFLRTLNKWEDSQ